MLPQVGRGITNGLPIGESIAIRVNGDLRDIRACIQQDLRWGRCSGRMTTDAVQRSAPKCKTRSRAIRRPAKTARSRVWIPSWSQCARQLRRKMENDAAESCASLPRTPRSTQSGYHAMFNPLASSTHLDRLTSHMMFDAAVGL